MKGLVMWFIGAILMLVLCYVFPGIILSDTMASGIVYCMLLWIPAIACEM